MQVRVSDIKSKLDTLCLKEQEILSTPVETAVDLELLELKLKTIRLEINYLKDTLISTNEMFISEQNMNLNNAFIQSKLLAIRSGFVDGQTMTKDHTAIVASNLPVFEIKPTSVLSLGNSSSIQIGNDKSFDTFIRRFEKIYKKNQVDVEKHWFFHLETRFEKDTLHFSWFNQNIKGPIENKRRRCLDLLLKIS